MIEYADSNLLFQYRLKKLSEILKIKGDVTPYIAFLKKYDDSIIERRSISISHDGQNKVESRVVRADITSNDINRLASLDKLLATSCELDYSHHVEDIIKLFGSADRLDIYRLNYLKHLVQVNDAEGVETPCL